MFKTLRFSAFVALGFLVVPAWAGLEELAREGDWQRVLEIAARRGDQLPLSPEEAMIAAHAARELRDSEAEKLFLTNSIKPGTDLGILAEIQLALLLGGDEADRAVALALPGMARGMPWPIREAATDVAVAALASGVQSDGRASLETVARKLSKSLRRRLELALALSDQESERSGLERLLASSTRDLTALRAAERLAEFSPLTAVEEWRIASTWYRHAMYDRAAPLLEGLAEVGHSSIPRDEVAFLRGRCAFRHDRWAEAISWYQRAIGLARQVDRRADFEVHLGRSFELDGDLDAAVEAAIRALRLKTNDDRRLFLARLRLRRGEPDLAEQGINRLRSRTKKSRGQVMLAIDELRRGDGSAAQSRLLKVRGRPWTGPASVVAASLASGDGEVDVALQLLDRAVRSMEGYWEDQARQVMGQLPDEAVAQWRGLRTKDVAEATGRSLWLALGRWAALEPDPLVRESLRRRIEDEFVKEEEAQHPRFPPGLAADLWRLGLDREAARWDPSGFPRADARESAWSASKFFDFGYPGRSTRVADGAWRQAGSEVPDSALPTAFQKTLYPLPNPDQVRLAASKGGVDWPLLAAVAREESRWDARAVSAVGARGLVQLMPATAVAVARRIGEPEPTAEDLFEAPINLTLGASELARLIEVFGGRRAPAIAAYNAGETQARLWLEQCGAGCSDALYLFNISFGVTRVYTAQVLSASSRYADLYSVPEAKKAAKINIRSEEPPAEPLRVRATTRSPR